MTTVRTGTTPLGTTAPLRGLPQITTAAPAPKPQAAGDTLSISRTATARLAEKPGPQTFEGKALFGTAKDTVDKNSTAGLDKTLDQFAAEFQKLTPEQQKAMLDDPGFKITVEGHASNLGNASKYDNSGLSGRRATNTAKYVVDYLKKKGIDVGASHVQAEAKGTPAGSKKVDNNDQEDRSANIKIQMPAPKEEPPKPAPTPEKPAAPAPPPPPAPPAPPPAAGGPISPVVLPAGPGENEEDKARKKQESKPAAPEPIPMGTWSSPKTDGSYVPPKDPYQSGTIGPGYVRPSNYGIDK